MRKRRLMCAGAVVAATVTVVPAALAQSPPRTTSRAGDYLDPATGLSLEDALTRALEQEPSLRAVRSEVDAARGRQAQAALRSNPTVSFEQREEPGGTDRQTMVAVEWPLDLFRRARRTVAAERDVAVASVMVADRERILAGEVRARYGSVAAGIRDLQLLEELAAAAERQHDLLRARAEEGAAPPLERDLLDVEVRRLESERLLQVGRTEAALADLRRVLGMSASAPLKIRNTLEDLVQRDERLATAGADLASSVEQRSDVREAQARIRAAEARVEQAGAEGWLDVSLFGGYTRMDAGFPQSGFAEHGHLERIRGVFHYVSAGAMVTVPLLNRNQGDIAAARAERSGAVAAHEAVRLGAETELAGALARNEQAQRAVSLYASGVQALGRQNLSVIRQTYELGRATVFDVLAEQRRYLDLERTYTEILREAYDARTALDLARGGVR